MLAALPPVICYANSISLRLERSLFHLHSLWSTRWCWRCPLRGSRFALPLNAGWLGDLLGPIQRGTATAPHPGLNLKRLEDSTLTLSGSSHCETKSIALLEREGAWKVKDGKGREGPSPLPAIPISSAEAPHGRAGRPHGALPSCGAVSKETVLVVLSH